VLRRLNFCLGEYGLGVSCWVGLRKASQGIIVSQLSGGAASPLLIISPKPASYDDVQCIST